jgi:Fur family transcriptional regulator, peroxide stress response regulator
VAKQRRNTKQLELIWQAIQGDATHPTADQVFLKVRRQLPSISLGTVYRNLQKLVSEGRLQVLTLGRAQHFDPLVRSHQHFICEQCEQVYDLLLDSREKRFLSRLPNEGFTVTSHQLSLFGRCKQCGG